MDGALAPWHIIIIAVLFLVLFGAKRLPDSARALGQSLRIFKAETTGLRADDTPVAPVASIAALPPAAIIAPLGLVTPADPVVPVVERAWQHRASS